MFDGTNSYPVPNPLNRHVIGSDTTGLKYHDDGSLTFSIQTGGDCPGMDSERDLVVLEPMRRRAGSLLLLPEVLTG
jgi:hypothetical protein